MTTRAERKIRKLQDAKSKGVHPNDLFHEEEKDGNIRKLKHQMTEMLGDKNAIQILDNGNWVLQDYYWTVSMTELYLMRIERKQLIIRNLAISLVAILGLFLVYFVAVFDNITYA